MKQNFGIYTDLYNSAINDLDSGRFLPNIKAVRKQIADAKKINTNINQWCCFLPRP